VVDRIGSSILRGELGPGAKLPDEVSLATQFGVSRTVLREAMRVLASKGLVESRPRIGTRVRPRASWNMLDPDVLSWRFDAGEDQEFLLDLGEVREMIEPTATHLAALRATSDERTQLLTLCQSLDDAAHEPQSDHYIEIDQAFHMAILHASRNELLVQLGAAIQIALRFSRQLTASITGNAVSAMPLHWEVARAIAAADAGSAELAMRALLKKTATDIDLRLTTARTPSESSSARGERLDSSSTS
jgi:GntR family transcriptional regulator, galactonate operon transcriptional repressor